MRFLYRLFSQGSNAPPDYSTPLPCPGFVCPPPPVPPVHGLVCARTTPVWVRGVDGRFKADGIESKDLRGAVDKYINVGDWVLDQGIAFMASSKYFERKR